MTCRNRRSHSAYGVPEPVGGSGETHTTRSDRKREDLADQDPGTRAPGGGKEEDEDGNECNLSIDRRKVVGAGFTGGVQVSMVESDRHANDRHEELADKHAESTVNQERTSAELFHGVEGDWRRADVDQGKDQGDQEGVLDGAGGLQKGSGVVEDEVDTSPG